MSIPSILIDHEEKVELRMRQIFEEHDIPNLPLYRMMQYQLGWLGKDGIPEVGPTPSRLYGALCMESANTFGGSVLSEHAGAAIEMLVNSISVHEEMQTVGNPSHSRDAVWWVWGPAQAINVGDSLHALSRLSIFGLQKLGLTAELTVQAVSHTDQCSLNYYEGQFLDLSFQERLDVSENQYEQMVVAKNGSLLSSAIQLGAMMASASDSYQSVLREFAIKLALAIQIQTDLSDLWPTKPNYISFRVMNKSKLLPVINALENATLAQKKSLGSIYFKRVMDPSDLPELRQILENAGSKQYTEFKLKQAKENLLQIVESLDLGFEAKNRWVEIVNAMTENEP